ncbi:MAG TPA: radical SAM protein [Candidatus Hydrogenedentes bacterium]|nr:radical SAM protein [Candidatus Hydrogenedentota bacterium]
MRFEGRVFRPPSEASSVLIQLTVGCSHNQCIFCAMYREKRYRVRPLAEVLEDVDALARMAPRARRVFVCDGNALSAGFETFAALCQHLHLRFPVLERISAYVNARDLLRLSDEELRQLRGLEFSLGYLGLESGSREVLRLIHKGATPETMVEMADKARKADIALSAIVLLGAGGKALSKEHIRGTIEVLNLMKPSYLSFLTAMIVPKTPLMCLVEEGGFQPLTDKAILQEAKSILERLEMDYTLFRMNHVSNLISLGGCLPEDTRPLLKQLEALLPRADDTVSCVCSEEEGLML